MTVPVFAVFAILARFPAIIGESSNISSVTPAHCKYSDIRQELDAVRQLLNQETLIRMSLEKTLKSLVKEVEEWKRNDGVIEVVTPNLTTEAGPSKYYKSVVLLNVLALENRNIVKTA